MSETESPEILPSGDDPVVDDPTPARPRRWWQDKMLLAMMGLLLIGSIFVVRGVLIGLTGDERADLPTHIESVEPVPDAVQVLNQSNVFVDLQGGYTGVLVIDGVEIETQNIDQLSNDDVEPGEQIDLPPVTRFEPGNATLTFTPSSTAPITQFVDGEHTVTVIYWPIDEGRQFARSFTWTFNVV